MNRKQKKIASTLGAQYAKLGKENKHGTVKGLLSKVPLYKCSLESLEGDTIIELVCSLYEELWKLINLHLIDKNEPIILGDSKIIENMDKYSQCIISRSKEMQGEGFICMYGRFGVFLNNDVPMQHFLLTDAKMKDGVLVKFD